MRPTRYQTLTSKSGVYKVFIRNTEYFYIGSSKTNVRKRVSSHLVDLRKNKHSNIIFQRLFNKYGQDALEFTLLEETSKENTRIREQFYIDKLKPNINIRKKVDDYKVSNNKNSFNKASNNGMAKLTNHQAAQIKTMISQCIGGKEIKDLFNISASSISEIRYNKKWKNCNPSIDSLVIYKITSPEGKVYRYNNLYLARKILGFKIEVCKAFKSCLSNRDINTYKWQFKIIKYPKFNNIINPKLKYCDLKLVRTDGRQFINNQYKTQNYKFISPEGVVYQPTYLSDLAKQFNLQVSKLGLVWRGKRKHHKGWYRVWNY